MKPCTSKESIRPYIIINCAMSLDGKLALPSRKPIKLSSLEDFKRVHELRNYCDGVLVGINTVLMDDPKLTVKSEFVSRVNQPTRIVLDTQGQTPKDAAVLDGKARTFIIMDRKLKSEKNKFKNAEIIYCNTTNDDLIELKDLLTKLKRFGIENLLVEGGETIIYNFLKHKFVDELYVYISNVIIGGTSAPTLAGGTGAQSADDVITLKLISNDRLGDGILLKFLVP
ncbi:2,5-diamino-6-(ribosylamino)-4(3H)-pyrimidinone 5'-phosphate reductase [[Eubacterium] cellulosolvens]